MTIKALYPTVRPTLNLDFAKTKALDPRVTFSRASTGTFVGSNGLIQTAASGAARFDHNPATGESLGLLAEEARTNLVTYSEQFDNAAWGKNQITITANSATAPDGTITADTFAGNGANNGHYMETTGAAGAKTISVFAKANTNNFVQLLFSGSVSSWANFNVSTGVVGSIGTLCSASIQQFANGWYRCILATTDSGAGAPTFSIVTSATSGRVQSNTLSTSVYLWGCQSELGTFPTSYIPTVASTVTRAADVASMTGTNFSSWYRQDQGTIYQSVKLLAASPQDNQYYGALFATATKVAHDYSSLGGGPSARTIILSDAGATSATLVILPFNATTRKTASAMQVGSVAFAANGQIVTGTATAMPSTVDGMFLSKSGFTPNTTISRFAYYPVRLPDAQLQALTAT
jgi:hypothetical protein